MVTKATVIQIHAPTDVASDTNKDDFYNQLQGVLNEVMGDFNAVIGSDRTGWKETIRQEADGERTDNRERLLSCCSANSLKVGGWVCLDTREYINALGDYLIGRQRANSTICACQREREMDFILT